jgi:NADPH2:quinone reductase
MVADSIAALFAWHAQGRLHPRISHVLPLEAAEAGLDLLRQRRATGKVVIQVGVSR